MTIGVAAEYTLVMERIAEEKERLGDNLAAIQESVREDWDRHNGLGPGNLLRALGTLPRQCS